MLRLLKGRARPGFLKYDQRYWYRNTSTSNNPFLANCMKSKFPKSDTLLFSFFFPHVIQTSSSDNFSRGMNRSTGRPIARPSIYPIKISVRHHLLRQNKSSGHKWRKQPTVRIRSTLHWIASLVIQKWEISAKSETHLSSFLGKSDVMEFWVGKASQAVHRMNTTKKQT